MSNECHLQIEENYEFKTRVLRDPVVASRFIELPIDVTVKKRGSRSDSSTVDIRRARSLNSISTRGDTRMINVYANEELPRRFLALLHKNGGLNMFLTSDHPQVDVLLCLILFANCSTAK